MDWNVYSMKKWKKLLCVNIIVFCIVLLTYILNEVLPVHWNIITSGSMEPVLMTNSLVLTDNRVSFEDIEVGDIIAYTTSSVDRVVMHRVQRIQLLNDGGKMVYTKGDNNQLMDTWVVCKDDYIGKVIGENNALSPLINFLYKGNAQEVDDDLLFLSCVCITLFFEFFCFTFISLYENYHTSHKILKLNKILQCNKIYILKKTTVIFKKGH